jgi:hypothetical protein
MPARTRTVGVGGFSPEVAVTTASRERFWRRVAMAVTALAAFVAVLLVSVSQVILGLLL